MMSATNRSGLAGAANAYAQGGLHVFPLHSITLAGACTCGETDCQSPGKHPRTPHGVKDASDDPDVIEGWWSRWPDANIGVATGPGLIYVIDIDGDRGAESWRQLSSQYGGEVATRGVTTGNGRHLWYVTDLELGNTSSKLAPGVDTRGRGGYVVAPPSVHAAGGGTLYSWENPGAPLAPLPQWVADLLQRPERPATPHSVAPTPGRDPIAQKRLQGLAGHLALMAPDTGRNNALNHAAYTCGRLVAAGRLDRDHAEHVLATAAQRCGLGARETEGTIRSGLDSGADDPDYEGLQPQWQPPTATTLAAPTGTQGAEEGDIDPLAGLEGLVQHEIARILARDRAREIVAAQEIEDTPPPALTRLDEFLAQPDPEVTFRIDQLWPADGRCLLAAQYKAGKTTTVGNILRSLVDGQPLFATYPVAVPEGRIVLIDDELHENTLRRWLRDQDIGDTAKIDVVALRGRLSTFNILDPATRTIWADRIRDAGADVVILDCLRPIIDALGLSEDKDVGKVLTAFDELLEEADVSEAIIVHHMGHHGERSRGDSRLRDWPDAEWKLVRETPEDGEDDPTAPRYFSAMGRDVEVTEQRLDLFDGRRLEIVGGSRKAMKEWELVSTVVQVVIDNPGLPLRDLDGKVRAAGGKGKTDKIRAVRELAIKEGWIEQGTDGLHPCVPRVPPFRDFEGHGGTAPSVTVMKDTESQSVPPVPHPGARPVPRPLKGEPGHARGSESRGTPPGANEVPL